MPVGVPRNSRIGIWNEGCSARVISYMARVRCTAPAAVTGITADPGHNKIAVNWAHDGTDVATYEVYRGLWYDTTPGVSAYPEYDDLAGDVIPTRPADYDDAVASAEWEFAGTVPAGTLAFTYCQVPIVYRLADDPGLTLHLADGTTREMGGLALDEASSREIFDRSGAIARVEVAHHLRVEVGVVVVVRVVLQPVAAQPQRHHPPAARGGDARFRNGYLLRQDRDDHPEQDGGDGTGYPFRCSGTGRCRGG